MAVLKVLVQAGHAPPREPGFESATGTNGEIATVLRIRDALCTLLHHDPRYDPIPVPGDIPTGIRVAAALFLHCDGAASPNASGYSFGYPDYTVNERLADLIDTEFQKIPGHPPHHADNYTGDLRGYYGFSRVDTPGPEVLVEHGFLTNPAERAWIEDNIDELAQAEYRALLEFFQLGPIDDTRRKTLRAWILARRAEGWTWARIKRTANWREFKGLGGT